MLRRSAIAVVSNIYKILHIVFIITNLVKKLDSSFRSSKEILLSHCVISSETGMLILETVLLVFS